MRKLAAVWLALALAAPLAAQDMGDFTFIDELASKKEATQGDAVRMFVIHLGKNPTTFAANLRVLEKENIVRGMKLAENKKLRRGTLALMAARQLKLGDSLLYAVFGGGRYAVTACVANDVMTSEGGEWDVISGGELVEVIGKMSEKAGGAK